MLTRCRLNCRDLKPSFKAQALDLAWFLRLPLIKGEAGWGSVLRPTFFGLGQVFRRLQVAGTQSERAVQFRKIGHGDEFFGFSFGGIG